MTNHDDEFGYSPDIGRFVTRAGITYTETGVVYERMGGLVRTMPRTVGSHENYADWTDEQRASKLAETTRLYDEAEREREAARAARRVLVESAKKKLTDDEFEAVIRMNDDED